jgi:hypothetical protein
MVLTQTYRYGADSAPAIVKSLSISPLIERRHIETEITEICVIRRGIWRARGTTDRAVAGDWAFSPRSSSESARVVDGLRFAQGIGLLHAAVKAGNVLFDADRLIQIADFRAVRLEAGEVELLSGKKVSPSADVCGFASLLSEIAIGAGSSTTGDRLNLGGGYRSSIPSSANSEEVSAFAARVESVEQSGE